MIICHFGWGQVSTQDVEIYCFIYDICYYYFPPMLSQLYFTSCPNYFQSNRWA